MADDKQTKEYIDDLYCMVTSFENRLNGLIRDVEEIEESISSILRELDEYRGFYD
jgi:uncharacterized coiled-coil DUF342 family protein